MFPCLLAFKLDLVGAEYITSSHGISVKNATKDLERELNIVVYVEKSATEEDIENIKTTISFQKDRMPPNTMSIKNYLVLSG